MKRAAGGRWVGGLLAVLLVTAVAGAQPPVDPRLAHAQWLADSGHPYRAAAELARIPAETLSPAAAERRAALQGVIVDTLVAAWSPDGAVAQADGPQAQLEARLREAAQDGADSAGIALEPLLGAAQGSAPVARGVRDQTHLLLGRRALGRGASEVAREHFGAVHSPGPFATEALLALGWSYLLPVDERAITAESEGVRSVWSPIATPLRANSADTLAALRRSTPFRSASGVARSERAADLEAALGSWQELIGRDPLDPAVQEGLLAIAYAYQHLGAQDQALERYEATLGLLRRGRALLDDALAHIGSGALVDALRNDALGAPGGWPWWAVERRAGQWWRNGGQQVPPLFYARYLMADARFRESAQRARLLAVIAQRMETVMQTRSGSAASRARAVHELLRPVLQRQERALQERASELVTSRLTLTERYMAEAHFALARMRERGGSDVAALPETSGEVRP